LKSGAPAVLAGDFNVMPTELDFYAPERWVDGALFRPEVRDAYRRKAGPTRCGHSTRMSESTRSGNISRTPLPATPDCASITCC
jgi:exonuclease III